MDSYEERCNEHKHIIQRLKKNEPLTERWFEIALSAIEVCYSRNFRTNDNGDRFSEFLNNMCTKITAGEPLTPYEIYVIDDLISNMDYKERKKARKSNGASYGHIKRRLKREEPLTGKTLELALELTAVHGHDEQSRFIKNIGVKMEAGKPLDEYEYHLVVDVLMRHAKLGA